MSDILQKVSELCGVDFIRRLAEEENPETYEGQRVLVRVCPVCLQNNSIYSEICKVCKGLFDQMLRAVKKYKIDIKDPSSRMRLLMGMSKKTNMAKKVFHTLMKDGPTNIDDPSTIHRVENPTRLQKLESALHRLNAQPGEYEEMNGIKVLKQKEHKNFLLLSDILKRLDDMKVDEFYRIVGEYNAEHPDDKLLPITLPGGSYFTDPVHQEKEITPEPKNKLERYREEPEEISDSKKGGYYTTWAWADWTSASGQQHTGVKAAFKEFFEEKAKREKEELFQKTLQQSQEIDKKLEELKQLEEEIMNSDELTDDQKVAFLEKVEQNRASYEEQKEKGRKEFEELQKQMGVKASKKDLIMKITAHRLF